MDRSFKTFLKHTAKDYYNQSVNPPVVRASTIIFKSMQDITKTQKKYSFLFFSLAICMPAQPPVDSQRVNAPLTGKKTDQENNNFRAQVVSKLGVDP